MKIATSEMMQQIDRSAIHKFGIPAAVLMERAGLAVAEKVRELFEKKRVAVLAGGGNNGGDGIVAARNLHNWGWEVKVLLLLREDRLSPDCLSQYRIAKQSGVPVSFRKEVAAADLQGSVVIDAILGTGINKVVTSLFADVIRVLNSSDADVISVDIPSGISSDSGRIMGEAVRADFTVTFGIPKVGHYLYPGAEYSGRLFTDAIGFPPELLNDEDIQIDLAEKESVSYLLPERPAYSHKGDYGHVLIVAGSRGKTGAALMAARACLRTGAGLVTIGAPESLIDSLQAGVTEEMLLPLPDTGRGVLSEEAFDNIAGFLVTNADVLAIGPGITTEKGPASIVKRLLEVSAVPMVLDADAINVLSGCRSLIKKVKAPVVLTPHTGELARLLCNPSAGSEKQMRLEIEEGRLDICRAAAKETGSYLVLKGAPTIVSAPEGTQFLNSTGNSGMATAGSGDVLAGMIAALIGQSLQPVDAARLAVFLHGSAGDIAMRSKGRHSLIASDIIEAIPEAFLSLHA